MTQKLSTQELLKKHHFWIVLGVGGVLLPLGLWFYGVSNLKAMTDTERSAREQWHNRVNSLRPAAHPNGEFTKVVLEVQNVNSGHVFDGWSARYDAQKDLIEKWPSWLTADYQQHIRDCLKNNKPFSDSVRQAYLNRIKEEFPNLYKKIAGGLREPVQDEVDMSTQNRPRGSLGSPMGGQRNTGGRYSGLLAWDAAERMRLQNKLGGSWTTPPSTEEMIYTQETLNIYEVLIEEILNKANQDEEGRTAPEHHQATIKKIQALLIGRDAEPLPVMGGGSAAAAEGMDPSGDAGGESAPVAQEPVGRGDRSNRGTNEAPPDGKFRFVDANGRPVPDQKAAPPFAEFRMLPVTMQLVMDHRRIPELLALCANSPLPLEVRQVNVTSVRGNPGSNPGSQQQQSSGFGGGSGARRPDASGGASQLDAEVELGPTDMMVEIRGLIYLFNPPDRALIGTGTAAAEGEGDTTTAEGEVPGTPPADGAAGEATPPAEQPAEGDAPPE